MKAVLCPVCNGKGTICDHEIGTPQYLHPTCPICHGCNGLGWVEVHEQLLISSEPVIPLEEYTELTYPLGYS